MKKIILAGLIALSSAAIIPTYLSAQKSTETLLAQNSRSVVFRSTQRLKCSKTGEEIFLYTNRQFKYYEGGIFKCSGTYSLSGKYITLYAEDGDELLYGTFQTGNGGNVTSMNFGGDIYYPMR